MDYYLIFGRANAGKSTFARKTLEKHLDNFEPAVVIDGDAIRNLYGNSSFDDHGRWNNINICINLAHKYMTLNIIPIIAIVCPKEEYRKYIVDELGDNGELVYIEGGELWEGTEFEEPEMACVKIPDWRIK